MSALRIAVDVTPIRAGGECGGAKPFVLELLKGLVAAPRRHEFRLLTTDDNHEAFATFDAPNVTRERVDTMGVRSAARGLRAAGIDLLFCPMTAPTYAEPGVATVSILYDLQHLAYPSFFEATELVHRTNFYQNLVDRADHVVCISEFSRNSLTGSLGVPPERTSVVPIAIQDRLPHYDLEAAWALLAARGIPRGQFTFYPANFWPHKNHRMLLLAFSRFMRERPASDLHLVLTGELLGEGDAVLSAIEHMGLAPRVHLLGFVPEAELGALWSAASLLVFPSLYEGFGIPLTEAMSFSVPIVSSRAGSLPEVGGDEAVYFDARKPQSLVDALAMAVDQPEEMRCRARRARGRLSAYSPTVVVERYLDVFDHVALQAPSGVGRMAPELRSQGTVAELQARLAAADTGRVARLAMIEQLGRRLEESDADRRARLQVIERLAHRLEESEADRAARLDTIEGLRRQLAKSSAEWPSQLEHDGLFRFNRRARAVRLMKSGRERYRGGLRLRGLLELTVGAALAPDVACEVLARMFGRRNARPAKSASRPVPGAPDA